MAAKIRLARRGRKKHARYDIVIADTKAPRDSNYKERIGTFNPNVHPAEIRLNTERALYWVMVGAQPTDTARSILSRMGVMMRKHLQVGVLKGAISQEVADKRYESWVSGKDMTNMLILTEDGKEIGNRAEKPTPPPVEVPVKEEAAPVEEPKEEAPVEAETAPAEEVVAEVAAEEVEAPAEEAKEEEAPAEVEATAAPAEEENTEEPEAKAEGEEENK